MALVKVKNTSGAEGTWQGQTIAIDEYYEIPATERPNWADDSAVFASVSSGDLLVNDGASDITAPLDGWRIIEGVQAMPYSRHLEGKLAVHSSSKPEPSGVTTYAVWAGAGDDVAAVEASDSIGSGELLTFDMSYDPGGAHIETKDVKFDPRHGRVWVHEAYVKFENGGIPDFFTSDIMAPATPLQQVANLDYIVENNFVKYAPGGPGTGTHGLAGTPALLPRTYSNDGDWDFDGTNLTPNFAGTGGYRIADIDMSVHRYFNKVPLYGTSSTYFTMSSEETAELPVAQGYFIRINVHNNSNSAWYMSCIIEIYREKTVDP